MKLPRRTRPILIIILVFFLTYVIMMDIVTEVKAETASSSFRDNCPRYPVCLMKNVLLNTKYGQITSLRNMVFNMFAVYANGTVFFDGTGLIPNAMEILLFQLQSYGNGTFDIRIAGPPAVAVDCQGCPVDSHLSANLPSGQGTEIFLSGNMQSSLVLTINYTPFGGACDLVCISNPWISPRTSGLLLIGGAGLLLFVLVFGRPRKERRKKEEVSGIISVEEIEENE